MKEITSGYRIGFDVAIDDSEDAFFYPETQLVWHGVHGGSHNSVGTGDLLFKR